LQGETLADEVAVLKMVWHHDAYFDNDRLSAGAFRREDLVPEINKHTGKPNFVSVDERSCVEKRVVDDRIKKQGAKDPDRRKEARFAEYLCGTIRKMRDQEGEYPLDVLPERIPENEAHCGIHNVSKQARSNRQRRDYADELRSLLIEEGTHAILTYEEVFLTS
jgi:hypothetical protein